MLKQYMIRCWSVSVAALAVLVASPPLYATELNLSDTPLFLSRSVAPLNMLVVGRDHKLYYEAYNDASDLNGDGKIDVGYKGYLPNPTQEQSTNGGIDYYGYFDSYKCYTYANNLFSPVRVTATKRCGGSGEWSGDYLNYLTMSRIDALRKVLYGGKRDVDNENQTILVRSHIPMDAHSWGKEYSWDAPEAFNIRDFTPYARPPQGQRHLFANTTPNNTVTGWAENTQQPRLRVLLNRTWRIWEWVSKESPVAGTRIAPAGSDEVSVSFDDEMRVRVAVCVSNLLGQENCKRYPNQNYKPIGLLHEFGENDSMMFGLLTGSYTANKSGGVLRKNVSSFRDELDPDDGTWNTDVSGIVKTLDSLRVAGYTRYTDNGGTNYDCGLPDMARGAPQDGNCRMWGNPVAEMMYETLRYFNGQSPTRAFIATKGGSNTDVETRLGLSKAGWQDPYAVGRFPTCSKPFQTVMADINNSYDSDQLPGTRFDLEVGSDQIDDDLPDLDVGALADTITAGEERINPGSIVGNRFIGHSGATYDGSPKPKQVTSLANIRGLAPEEPTKQGSYYSASVAYRGLNHDANPRSDERVQTFAVALASPLPQIKIPVGAAGSNRFVTLVPFAKSVVYNNEINRDSGSFQPTNQIVDFYVENMADDGRSGTFQVNFEDVEAGNDHDMDAIARYTYRVLADNTVQVEVSSDYQAGGIIHHIGYVISGTEADGVYLVVQDCNKNTNGTYTCNGNNDRDYFLDTPPGQGPGGTWSDNNTPLPGYSRRVFVPSADSAATLLKDPLWYAAKWGGFEDSDDDGTPNLRPEWDGNNDGNPDNYFLVTNALTLSRQLRETFTEITNRASSASAAAVNSGAISTDTRIYQASFDTQGWTGELSAFGLDSTGKLSATPAWDVNDSNKLGAPDTRNIITVNSDGRAVPFRWSDTGIDAARRTQLDPDPVTARNYLNYLRGDRTNEQSVGGTRSLRNRAVVQGEVKVLGDIVSSAPIYVGAPRGRFGDDLEVGNYSEFLADKASRNGVVYVGANDGMLHAFRADTYVPATDTEPAKRVDAPAGEYGRELFAFIPKTVFGNLRELPQPTYSHRFFVDGSPNVSEVYINNQWRTVLVGGLNKGGQGIYALDVTDPSALGTNSFLWEVNDRTSDQFNDLGYTYSQPAIVRLANGRWAAVFGNGYNNTENDGAVSSTGNGVLYVVDIATGDLLKKFDTGVGRLQDPTGGNRPNGLATPTMVDVDGDRIVDHAYVGDLFGNLWKIDLRATSSTNWRFAFSDDSGPLPFFKATDTSAAANPQPITSRVEVTRGPNGNGIMVLFGTGKYLEATDKFRDPQRVQTFYGLLDANNYLASDRIANRVNLVEQRIVDEIDLPSNQRGRLVTQVDRRKTSKGWFLNLVSPDSGYQGERVVTNPLIRDDRVIFTTLIPNDDVCGDGGRSWLMILDLISGKQLLQAQLDTDGDGQIDPPPANPDPNQTYDENVAGFSSGSEEGGIWSQAAGLRCVADDCPADSLVYSSTNSEEQISQRAMRTISGARGRQSWRLIR